MGDRSGAELTLAFALATFQTSVFVFVPLLLVFLKGDLGDQLEELDSRLGIALFLLLWLTTFYCTLRALGEVGLDTMRSDPTVAMLVKGAQWGAIDGMIFFVVLAVSILGYAVIGASGNDHESAFIGTVSVILLGLTVTVVGGVVALIIGGIAGLIAAIIEVPLIYVAQALTGIEREPPPRRQRVEEADAPAE